MKYGIHATVKRKNPTHSRRRFWFRQYDAVCCFVVLLFLGFVSSLRFRRSEEGSVVIGTDAIGTIHIESFCALEVLFLIVASVVVVVLVFVIMLDNCAIC